MRQEVIAHKKAQKHKVVDDPFEVKFEGQLQIVEFIEKILTNYAEPNEFELRAPG